MQKWQCPTGETWNRFVVDPDIPGHNELEQHLEICPYCRFLVAERQKELREIETAWNESQWPDIIHLSQLEDSEIMGNSHDRRMAAKGRDESSEAPAITMSSSDQSVILRAIKDANTGETWLYVMADELQYYQNVLIRPFGMAGDYVTDDNGRVNLGIIDWPAEESLKAEIHLPKAVFSLKPITELDEKGRAIELDSSRGDRLQITFMSDPNSNRLEIKILKIIDRRPDASLRVAVKKGSIVQTRQIDHPDQKVVSFDDISDNDKLEIYLYQ